MPRPTTGGGRPVIEDGRPRPQPSALARLCTLIRPTADEPDPLAAMLAWAARIAREIRAGFAFGGRSQEEDDLVSVAHLTVCRLAKAFRPELVPAEGDVSGAFRGYAYTEVWSQCSREARRIRNGGTYSTRREVAGVALVAAPFSDLAAADGAAFDTPGPRYEAVPAVSEPDRDPDGDEPEPLPSEVPFIYGRRLARR